MMADSSLGRPPPPSAPQPGGPALRLPASIGALLGLLVVVALLRQAVSPLADRELIVTFGLALFVGGEFRWERLYTLVTSMALHDGWLHLFFNAFWIATIGSLIHRALGAGGFLLLFLASGIAGGLTHTFLNWGQTVIAIGASGGVFGLIGAFGHLGVAKPWEPRGLRLRKLLAFTALMMAINLAFAYVGTVPGGSEAPIAWEAHAGGFLAGILLFPWLFNRQLQRRLNRQA